MVEEKFLCMPSTNWARNHSFLPLLHTYLQSTSTLAMSPPISQFFIVSILGDPLIFHDFRNKIGRQAMDQFCAKIVQSRNRDQLAPFLTVGETQYAFIAQNGLYFGCTSSSDFAPAFTIELLQRIATVIKDCCGELSEEVIRANFVFINEIILEICDFGYVQTTSIDALKPCIYSDVEMVKQVPGYELSLRNTILGPASIKSTSKTAPSQVKSKPISITRGNPEGSKEVYVDLREKLNVVFGANGSIINSEINGCIEIKNYVQDSPEINLGLPDDLVINSIDRLGYDHGICLNDCNFHESVELDRFEKERVISMRLPEGEATVMNYRISGIDSNCCPLRLFPFIEQSASGNYSMNVIVRMPVPKATTSVSLPTSRPGQNLEYVSTSKICIWKINRIYGGSHTAIFLKLNSDEWSKSSRKEINPLSIDFEVPMFTCSKFRITYLKINNALKGSNVNRWLRLVTHSGSYEIRM
ncbi:AP-4 complex subunit mu [Trichoplax sp. H2]|nr:AP-4 complex subunit mu [Trichoplax sp. H2]|eukprot:RDD42643.1 AP-4 complex subunit mu [Trichoplax sp. H2]